MHHFVYWLFDSQSGELLYIGRSHEPARRKRDFERIHKCKTVSGLSNRYLLLEKAQEHEIEMIKKHWPPCNKKVTSSSTSLGMKRVPASEETRQKMRMAKLGTKLTEEHKQKIGQAVKGKQPRLGHTHSKETRAKMSASHHQRLNH